VSVTVPVGLGERAYEVVVGHGLMDDAAGHIRPYLRRPVVAIVMDEIVAAVHGPRIIGALEADGVTVHALVIQPGEAAKSFEGLADLCDRLLELEFERGDLIVAFGGGVVGDLAGFVAAIYKRGIDFIQVPTTLLAQVDSSVGGKTAIDTPRGKNLIGAFHQPRRVLADLAALDTLPMRELISGYAEVIKYGLLGDRKFFDWLADNTKAVLQRDPRALSHAVCRSIEMKAEIVAADERESSRGRRALLNLGHTFAHALEAECGFGDALRHGEAVGLGCALAFRFSARLGLCPDGDAERAVRAIGLAGLPTRLLQIEGHPFAASALIAHMANDKKTRAGALTFILVREIGEAFVANNVDPLAVADFLIDEGALP
jgi:3-dehydroquinate synthase